MKINYENANFIEKINIHDYVIDDIKYQINQNKMSIFISNPLEHKSFLIQFMDILSYEIQSCDFWFPSPNILDWEVKQFPEQTLLNRIQHYQKSNNYTSARYECLEQYIDTIITFCSGNTIELLCKNINFIDLNT